MNEDLGSLQRLLVPGMVPGQVIRIIFWPDKRLCILSCNYVWLAILL